MPWTLKTYHLKNNMNKYPYIWFWKAKLPERKGMPCCVLARGKMNSILVKFTDGYRVITSRYAVRKIKGVTSNEQGRAVGKVR